MQRRSREAAEVHAEDQEGQLRGITSEEDAEGWREEAEDDNEDTRELREEDAEGWREEAEDDNEDTREREEAPADQHRRNRDREPDQNIEEERRESDNHTRELMIIERISMLRRLTQMCSVSRGWTRIIMNPPGLPASVQYAVLYDRQNHDDPNMVLYDHDEQRWLRMRIPAGAYLADSSHSLLCLMITTGDARAPFWFIRVLNVTTQTWVDLPPVPTDQNPYLASQNWQIVRNFYYQLHGLRLFDRSFQPAYIRIRPLQADNLAAGFVVSIAGFPEHDPPEVLSGRPFVVSIYSSVDKAWTTTYTQYPNDPSVVTFMQNCHFTSGSWVRHLNSDRLQGDDVYFATSRWLRDSPPVYDEGPEISITKYNQATGAFEDLYPFGTIRHPLMRSAYKGCLVRYRDDFYLVARVHVGWRILYIYKLDMQTGGWDLIRNYMPLEYSRHFSPMNVNRFRCVATQDGIFIDPYPDYPGEHNPDFVFYNIEDRVWSRIPRNPAWRGTTFSEIADLHISPNPCRLQNQV